MKQAYIISTRKNSKYYYYKLRHEKTYHSTGLENKQDAIEYVENILNGTNENVEIPILSEFSQDFFIWNKCNWIRKQHKKNKRFSKKHAKDRRGFLVNHILPKFGNRLMTTITPEEIDDWIMSIDLANQTLNQILFTIRTVYQEAVTKGLVKANPGIPPKL